MKIMVTVKQAATLDDEFELRGDEKDVEPDFREHELNEFDDYSVEEALRLKEGAPGDDVEVVAVTIGPEEADEALRQVLAKGVDRGIRVWSQALEGSDPVAVGRVLSKVAERESPGMIFVGAQSSDHAFATTGMAMAGFLRWPHVAVITKLDYQPGASHATVHRELEGGLEEVMTVQCPGVLGIQLGINQPRYASLRGIRQARSKEVEELTPEALGLYTDDVGQVGSASRVRRMVIPERGQAEMIEGATGEQAARLAAIIKETVGG